MPYITIKPKDPFKHPQRLLITRKSDKTAKEPSRTLQSMSIGDSGITISKPKRTIYWTDLPKVFPRLKTNKSRASLDSKARAFQLTYGASLKEGKVPIVLIQVMEDIKHGDQKAEAPIVTIGLTIDDVRICRRDGDIDAADPLKWKEFFADIRKYLAT